MPAYYLPRIGGVELAVFHLARELKRRGHQVRILTTRHSLHVPEREISDGLQILRLPLFFPHVNRNAWGRSVIKAVLKWILLPGFCVYNLFRLIQLGRAFRPEVVNLHYIGGNAFYAMLWRRMAFFRIVVTIHGADVQRDVGISRLARWLVSSMLRQADVLLANSQSMLAEVRRLMPGWAGKSVVVGNGVDAEEFAGPGGFDHPRPYILSVGRFVHKKGFDLLIRAFAEFARRHHDVDLLLAGGGEQLAACRRLASGMGLARRVRFLGHENHGKVVELIKGCLFFVLPSRQEPFGIVVLEAMAAGKAVVAARVGGVPEIIEHGENGLLVEPDSAEALLVGMEMLWSHPRSRRELAQQGKAAVRRWFTWGQTAERYLRAYRKDVAPHKRHRRKTAGAGVAMVLNNPMAPDPRVEKEARALARRGYRVTVFAWDRECSHPRRQHRDGFIVERIRVPSTYERGLWQLPGLLKFSWKVFRRLLADQFRIIHCHDLDTLPAGVAACWLNGGRLVFDAHEPVYFADTRVLRRITMRLGRILERLLVPRAHGVITVYDRQRPKYRRMGLRRVVLAPNFPETDLFRPGSRTGKRAEITIGRIGALHADSGVEELIDAVILLHRRYPGLKLLIAGRSGGGDLEAIRNRLAALGDDACFISGYDYDELPRYYGDLDIAVMTAHPDTWQGNISTPTKFFEALCFGVPVVASEVDGMSEIIRQECCGLVVERVTPPCIAEALEAFIRDPGLIAQMGRNGRRAVEERYNWNRTMDEIGRVYRELEASGG
jgi:glycosyltransferase involved in cell wall biosynthesis